MTKRPCWVEIHTRALENNFRFLSELAAPHAELLAVVKADAYGHGLALCAPAAVRGGARWLGVTSVEEGVAARSVCPDVRVLVIGGVFPGQGADVVRHRLTPVVWEPFQVDEIAHAARAAGLSAGSFAVHVEIDTGMSRQGVRPSEVPALLEPFSADSPLKLEGLMTHLFAADEANERVTHEQLQRLETAVRIMKAAGHSAEWLNAGSTAALLAGEAPAVATIASRHGMKALMRPGLAVYGLATEFDPAFEGAEPAALVAAREKLEPVLTWKTRVTSLRSIEAGDVVGYNGTFVATEPMRLALLAVGYADGLDRKLGNRFSVLVGGAYAPLVGRVSMDHAVVDVTGIPDVKPGDEVVLLGTQGAETVTAAAHATACGTIPWEVFTRIGARVERLAV
jgi:alanine racemase